MAIIQPSGSISDLLASEFRAESVFLDSHQSQSSGVPGILNTTTLFFQIKPNRKPQVFSLVIVAFLLHICILN